MSRQLEHKASRVFAFVLLVVMAVVPTAMAWADNSPTAAAHTADHHRVPASHHQLSDDCCDLCLTSCIVCVGLMGAAATFHSRTAPWIVPAIVGRAVRPPTTSNQHRLPFPLGPPLLPA